MNLIALLLLIAIALFLVDLDDKPARRKRRR